MPEPCCTRLERTLSDPGAKPGRGAHYLVTVLAWWSPTRPCGDTSSWETYAPSTVTWPSPSVRRNRARCSPSCCCGPARWCRRRSPATCCGRANHPGVPPPRCTATSPGYAARSDPMSIRTESPGYVVHLDDQQLDTATFAELVAVGREAAEDGRYDRAAQAFRTALDLWRGPALTGVTDQPWAVADAARLEEARLAATDDWAGVEMQLGRHAEIVEALQAAVRGGPAAREPARSPGVVAVPIGPTGRCAAMPCRRAPTPGR